MQADRKNAAAFYTKPGPAALLAEMALPPPGDRIWSDADSIGALRIADFACGAGALLTAAYETILGRAEVPVDHAAIMERVMHGYDIMPEAVRRAEANLAGVRPDRAFGSAHMHALPVGRNAAGGCHTGSPDLLDGPVGRAAVPDGSVDVILMNPPYSRTRIGRAAFDVAGLSAEERKACQSRWGRLIRDEPCTKTAGLAATFLCMARRKARPGGRIGFVLPRTAAFAHSWAATRDMLGRDFEDVTAITVASGGTPVGKAFSADTNMEEMLLTATRRRRGGGGRRRAKCVTLHGSVTGRAGAAGMAQAILGTAGGPVVCGGEVGVSRAFRTDGGRPWSCVGAVRDDVAAVAGGLADGRLLDLRGRAAGGVGMAALGDVFEIGPTHQLIGHVPDSRYPTGAFVVRKIGDGAGGYPSLWSVESRRQTRIAVLPTRECTVYGDGAEADRMWGTRSTLFYCRKMGWGARVLAAVTERPAMGGVMWTGLRHADPRVMKAFAVWANSIYGMVSYWARGSRTHPGRSMLEVRAMAGAPCPAFGGLGGDALDAAAADFDRLSALELLPARLAARDGARAQINRAASRMLGVPGYDTESLAAAWCSEPSVRGP